MAEVMQRPYEHADAGRLVRALFEEQVRRYGFADPVAADPAAYTPPRGLFLLAYVAGVPGACGGYRPYDARPAVVEVRKLYTIPELRGQGLGRLILSHLEQDAAKRGARWAVLETGVRNHAALALFRQAGYRPAARYVSGRDPAINRAFIKELAEPGSTAGPVGPARR
jgi:GNAT superfamily N-acetyltransferase